jgi:hypothetical protein
MKTVASTVWNNRKSKDKEQLFWNSSEPVVRSPSFQPGGRVTAGPLHTVTCSSPLGRHIVNEPFPMQKILLEMIYINYRL